MREVREETGYWARVIQWIDDVHLVCGASPIDPEKKRGENMREISMREIVIRFYLMEAVEDEKCARKRNYWPVENRNHQWLLPDEAKQTVSFDEARNLLEKAEETRKTTWRRLRRCEWGKKRSNKL